MAVTTRHLPVQTQSACAVSYGVYAGSESTRKGAGGWARREQLRMVGNMRNVMTGDIQTWPAGLIRWRE